MSIECRLNEKGLRHGAAALCLAIAVCIPGLPSVAEETPAYTQQEGREILRAELDAYEEYLDRTMQGARQILRGRQIGRRDIASFEKWQKEQASRFRNALRQADPLCALADAWAVSESLTVFLEGESGMDALPEATRDVALDMLRRREERLRHIAAAYLPTETVRDISTHIAEFARTHPAGDGKLSEQPTNKSWSFSLWARSKKMTTDVLSVPLAPVRALTGVAESGSALSGMRDSTAEAVQVARELPERIRKEMGAFLDDVLAEQEAIRALLQQTESAGVALREAAAETHATTRQVHESLNVVSQMLPDAESLARTLEQTAKSGTELMNAISTITAQRLQEHTASEAKTEHPFDVGEYKSAAIAIGAAAKESRELMGEIRALVERGQDDKAEEDEPGFDIREYRATALSLERAAAELRAVLHDLREMGQDGSLPERVAAILREADRSAEHAANQAERIVDHVALRVLQVALALLVFAMGLMYYRRRMVRTGRRVSQAKG